MIDLLWLALILDDVKDYLVNEYDENGKLAIDYKPIAIALYIDYFGYQGGRQEIIEYWVRIWNVKNEIESTYNIEISNPKDMTIEQMEGLMNYVDHPECEIDCEVLQ